MRSITITFENFTESDAKLVRQLMRKHGASLEEVIEVSDCFKVGCGIGAGYFDTTYRMSEQKFDAIQSKCYAELNDRFDDCFTIDRIMNSSWVYTYPDAD